MLTSDLVRVRVQKGELRPSFVDPASARLLERAGEVRAAFVDGIGKRREDLDEVITAIAGDGVDHKITWGLAKLAADRSSFDTAAPVDPAELRARVFLASARMGPLGEKAVVGGRPTATEVWSAVAAELGHPADALQGALYADHADQQVLQATDLPSPEWLLHRYNVALAQSALIRATEVRIDLPAPTPGRLRQLLRALKFHQLLFSAAPTAEGYHLVVDGPTSLFSQTTRYGLSLARAFPALLLQPRWSLEADVRWGPRTVRMKLSDADGLRSHYRDLGAYDTREAQWFAERFEALQSGWTLSRDAEPLLQGTDAVVVPDFSFEKDGRVAHLEILGFWRKATIPRRLRLLRQHGPANLVIAASKRLCADEAEELPDAVIPFAEVIPPKEVLRRIEACAIAPGQVQPPRSGRSPRR